MSATVWRVDIVFKKTVTTYVEADTIPEAERIIAGTAADMDVMDSPGSDFDSWDVRVARYPTSLHALNEEAYVWRAGEKWALCDEAGLRLEELSHDKASGEADG